MRKILLSMTLGGLLLTVGTGCLKDKDFEDQKYGIQIGDVKAVSFPQAPASPIVSGIVSQTATQTIDGPNIVLEQGGRATSDVKVTIAINNALVTGEGLEILPVGSYTLNTLEVTIPAGSTLDETLKITFPNASLLDANKSYGIGLTITAVTPGYTIASNQKNIVIAINILNQWAGDYDVTGYFFHPTAPRAIDDVKTLVTVSPITSRAPHSDLYTSNYYFDFDVSPTNTLVNYVPRGATPTGGQSGFMTTDVPFAGTFAPLAPGTPPWVHSTYNNTYNPATKTFWMHYGYGVGAANQSGWTRQLYEKWVRQ
ncbi:MAG: DUF1735 domain-containing protein [Chitinophagaceae bacterium]|nr:DUF1735 domain-containing protein [Chitinophagaceae bacterium]